MGLPGGIGEPKRVIMEDVGFGGLMRRWRSSRRMSQLDLSLEAGISSRHLSFVETGRSRPSRELVLRLAEILEVPLRERNDLLTAAGFAPAFRETGLDHTTMREARRALDLILERHSPYPAFVLDRDWNLVMANPHALEVFAKIPLVARGDGPVNAMDLIFSPEGLRPLIGNWRAVASHQLRRLKKDIYAEAGAGPAAQLLDHLRGYPGVVEIETAIGRTPGSDGPLLLMEAEMNGQYQRLFSSIATFGTAQDITLAELRIEMFFPADDATRRIYETD